MISVPSRGFDAEPVPPMTALSVKAAVLATSGLMACAHSLFGVTSSDSSGRTTLSIAMGLHIVPWFATEAKAVAIWSGATVLPPEPTTSDGKLDRSRLSALYAPISVAVLLMSHRSSWLAIATKAELTEATVAASTFWFDVAPVLVSLVTL